jgi:hypothetical protein
VRRGELYDYGQAGAAPSGLVLLVSSDAVLENLNIPWVCGLDVISTARRDHLLCVGLPGVGWCDTVTPHKLYRPWLGDCRGHIDDDVMERVDMALRVALEL